MFYWLDSFTQCLPPFFHQGMGSNPTSCIVFLTFYVDLIKWIGCPCVATASNNTHISYQQKKLRFFIDCLRSPYNIF
jgi:hypothetical protein